MPADFEAMQRASASPHQALMTGSENFTGHEQTRMRSAQTFPARHGHEMPKTGMEKTSMIPGAVLRQPGFSPSASSPLNVDLSTPPADPILPPGEHTTFIAQAILKGEVDPQMLGTVASSRGREERVRELLPPALKQMLSLGLKAEKSSHRRRLFVLILGGVVLLLVGLLMLMRFRYADTMKQQDLLQSELARIDRELTEGSDEKAAALESERHKLEEELRLLQEKLDDKDRKGSCSGEICPQIEEALATLNLTQQTIPREFVLEVEQQLRAFKGNGPAHADLAETFANKKRFGDRIKSALRSHKMPEGLLYLAMHESKLNPLAESVTGARGIMQLVGSTARELGLKVPPNWRERPPEEDERTDPEKSVAAGVLYLKKLQIIYQDFLLSMTAYNTGMGNIYKALLKLEDFDDRSYWYVFSRSQNSADWLTPEARAYVPKIVATAIVDMHRKEFGFDED